MRGCRLKRHCHRHGRRHILREPSTLDDVTPSHPLPTTGGIPPMARRTQPRHHNGRHNKPRALHMHPQLLSTPSPTLAANTLQPTSSRRIKPCRRGQRNKPWAPNEVSPPHQPFNNLGGNPTFSEGRSNDNFRVKGVPLPSQESSLRKHRPRRVYRRHGPRASN